MSAADPTSKPLETAPKLRKGRSDKKRSPSPARGSSTVFPTITVALVASIVYGYFASPLWATSPARDRFIAWAINRFTSHSPQLEAQRCRALARGEPFGPVVVEIGPGPGSSLRCLSESELSPATKYTGVEPNKHFDLHFHELAKNLSLPFEATVVRGVGERLPFDSGSVDTVIGLHVLCSVENVTQVLAEVRRVLRPGGKFVFMEHVVVPAGEPADTYGGASSAHSHGAGGGHDSHQEEEGRAAQAASAPQKLRMALARRVQRLVAPAWSTCFGCNFRDTELLLTRAFEAATSAEGGGGGGERFDLEIERFWAGSVPVLMQFVAPHIRGVATRVA